MFFLNRVSDQVLATPLDRAKLIFGAFFLESDMISPLGESHYVSPQLVKQVLQILVRKGERAFLWGKILLGGRVRWDSFIWVFADKWMEMFLEQLPVVFLLLLRPLQEIVDFQLELQFNVFRTSDYAKWLLVYFQHFVLHSSRTLHVEDLLAVFPVALHAGPFFLLTNLAESVDVVLIVKVVYFLKHSVLIPYSMPEGAGVVNPDRFGPGLILLLLRFAELRRLIEALEYGSLEVVSS